MNIVKENLNEFIQKKSLRNNIKVGIEYKREKEINYWFKKYLPDVKYKIFSDFLFIDNDLFLEKTEFTEFPDENILIYGTLDLSDNKIFNKLPNKLLIKGNLELINSKVSKLSQTFYLEGNIDISSSKIKKLPENLEINNNLEVLLPNYYELEISNSYLETFINNKIEINGKIYIRNSDVFKHKIPEHLKNNITYY